MTIMDILVIISLIASIASVILAIVAITLARTAEKDSHENFERTQKMMAEHYDKTKSVLAEIDKRAAVTEKTVRDSQEQLLNTVTSIIKETVIPKKQDMGEQFGIMFMQLMMQDPSAAKKIIETMKPLIELGKKDKQEDK